jgi:hypothetical protein
MKKLTFACILFMAAAGLGQNLQLHYDFLKDRQFFTSTLEMFKPDALGSTFWFVDIDYNSAQKNKSASLAYWEIARYFTLPILNKKWSATLQYNDGLQIGSDAAADWGMPLNSAWLGGFTYFFPISAGYLSVEFLYRYMDVSGSPDGQLTFVWFYPFFNGRLHFCGYLDYWSQDTAVASRVVKKAILQTEPQIWYVLNQHFCLGSEVEISRNFGGYLDEIKVFPTLGVKWTF